MRTRALEKLASKGIIVIQRKGRGWQVQCVRKDESGFLVDRQSRWGTNLCRIIRDLLDKVTLAG